MKNVKKPLALKIEVIRDLLPRDLKRVAGGDPTSVVICASDACTVVDTSLHTRCM